MAEDKLRTMRELVDKLNFAANAYYNGQGEQMSDYEWDALFDEVKRLEKETVSNSQTHQPTKFRKTILSERRKNTNFPPSH